VLDLGAGTGTLAIMIKKAHPGAQVIGVDGDDKIVKIARNKTTRRGFTVALNAGDAAALPYPDQTFDRVLSSLVMSLLSRDVKQMALRESYRVMKYGGEIHIADFAPPHTRWGRMVAPRIRRFEPIADNLDGLLRIMLEDAGFTAIRTEVRYGTLFGTLAILSGQKQGEPTRTNDS
jgi:ubiquinone/menaquinone biosynthesis C-methylase UbiE